MIAFGGFQAGDIARDVQAAMAREVIGSARFEKGLQAIVESHGFRVYDGDDGDLTTIGDPRAKIYWLEHKNADNFSTYESLFVWPGKSGLKAQVLQTVNIEFGTNFVWGDAYWSRDRLLILGMGFSLTHFHPGLLLSYRLQNGQWRLQQSLQMDSMSAPELMTKGGKLDPDHIIAPETAYKPFVMVDDWYPYTNYFKYAYRHGRYVYLSHHRPSSPVATMEDLIGAAEERNWKPFDRLVSPNIRHLARVIFLQNHFASVRSSDRLPYWAMPTPTIEISWDYRLWFRKVNGRYVITKILPGSPYFKNHFGR
jgi:hypothetical protein